MNSNRVSLVSMIEVFKLEQLIRSKIGIRTTLDRMVSDIMFFRDRVYGIMYDYFVWGITEKFGHEEENYLQNDQDGV